MPLASMSKVTSICGTPRGAGAMPVSSKVPSGLLSLGDLALALEDLDQHGRLVVVGGREDLAALGRDGRVALDELGHQAALGLDAEAQRGDVDEQDVLALALEDAGLQGGADGDDLVRVDALVGLLAAGELLDDLGDGGHPGGAADEHDVVDLGELDAGVGDDLVERRLGALEQVCVICSNCARVSCLVQVDRAVLGHREVLQRDVGVVVELRAPSWPARPPRAAAAWRSCPWPGRRRCCSSPA